MLAVFCLIMFWVYLNICLYVLLFYDFYYNNWGCWVELVMVDVEVAVRALLTSLLIAAV